jgi:hypothetical protein
MVSKPEIAAIATGDQRTVDDDITNILRPLIFPTLLEILQFS